MKGGSSGLHQNPYLQRAEVAKPGFRRAVQDCWKVRALHLCDCNNPGFKGLVETIQDSSRSHAPAITGLKALKMEVLRKRLS